MQTPYTNEVIASAASKVTVASSATAVATSFFSFNIVGLVAMCVGVIGLAVNIYFKHKSFKMFEERITRAKTREEIEATYHQCTS